MSLRMIHGWFTDTPSWRGPDGTPILESGMAAPISHSASVLESVSSAAMDGGGIIGDLIGTTDT